MRLQNVRLLFYQILIAWNSGELTVGLLFSQPGLWDWDRDSNQFQLPLIARVAGAGLYHFTLGIACDPESRARSLCIHQNNIGFRE